MMDYRKTILIMTDADGAETAKAIKLRLTQADASVAVIVIGVNELQNSIVEAAKNYLWKKDGFTRRRWEAHRLAQAEKALDEIPKGVPKFDATKLKHVKMQNILMRYRPALMLYLTPQELGIGLSARNKLMPNSLRQTDCNSLKRRLCLRRTMKYSLIMKRTAWTLWLKRKKVQRKCRLSSKKNSRLR